MLTRRLAAISLLGAAALVCGLQWAIAQPSPHLAAMGANGIFVGDAKVYDDHSLQTLLNSLKSRLGQLSGLDQSTLVSRVGGLQGASVSQLGFSVQGSGMPLPGKTTTVTSPGQSQVTTSPQVSPAAPTLSSAPSFSQPSTFSQSALNTLDEQMQLNYEIINLQMLLEGSLTDQYVGGTNIGKRHATVGFPISITVPSKDYSDAVAEVEVTACNGPGEFSEMERPSLMSILPREKTYNVATISNKFGSLGASAVVANVISVGASFLWGHQTYYLVQDQDTVAIQRPLQNKDSGSSQCVTFAWQFRPVLGEKMVRQGLRQTFAQISFPPATSKGTEQHILGTVTVETRWLKYDRKTGIVGDEVPGSQRGFAPSSNIPNFDRALLLRQSTPRTIMMER